MKATVLQIGDWVKLMNPKGECIDYVKVDANLFSIFLRDGEEGFVRFGPIPLTPEILEKNGWEKAIGGNPVEVWTIKKGVYLHNIDNDYKLREGAEFNVPNIQYVHTLQHALRLCGLNEIADNFKV